MNPKIRHPSLDAPLAAGPVPIFFSCSAMENPRGT